MDIQLHEISVRDVFNGYKNDEESGQVVAGMVLISCLLSVVTIPVMFMLFYLLVK